MKYTIPLIIVLLICSDLFAQDNVGIGTTTPAEKLHIMGNLRVDGRLILLGPNQTIYGDNSSAFYFDGNHTNITQLILRDMNDVNHGRLYGYNGGEYFGLLDGDGNWSYITRKDFYTGFRVDDNELMRINANGHVGIGNLSAPGKLTVQVDSAARGFEVHTAFGNTHIPWTNGWSYLAGQGLIFRTTAANTERARIMPDGKFGIGITAPTQSLHTAGNIRLDGRTLFMGANQTIYGDNASAFYFDGNHPTFTQLILRDPDNAVHGRVYGYDKGKYFGLLDGDGNWSYITQKDVYTGFRVNDSEKMRIMANGNVGVGTTSPAGKLSVTVGTGERGFEVIHPEGATHLPWTNGWSYLSGAGVIFRTSNNSERMRISPNGNVGIGTTNPTSKLAVNGNVRSKEVLVELSNWPDYVFDDSYQLPTLIEEESFINENGHLSGFKSEAEMEGTITVGDVTKRQQEKIEQIMLHLIKMEKDNEAMKSEMKSMETEMEGMGTKMKSMESKISELTEENQKLKGE